MKDEIRGDGSNPKSLSLVGELEGRTPKQP